MYIEKIKSPADLKKLDLKELQVVADETRQAVLNRVSKHGGHVGPNLGFVEATVALHYVFNAPKDRLVFDVSHQCYPHKVLTGRAAGFLGDVDDMNAISGYSSPAECPEYDNFEVGHTSTSVSLATGLQKARDVKGTDENIIAIIGDGSLSGGEAFEGLDEASELGTGIIIVVNDNEMSIAENHGGTNPSAMMPGNLDDGSAVYLNENQRTQATNYNDMPVKTYDFQAPLGEFGQKNPHYFMLRKLHLFMHDYAEVLAPMESSFPCRQDIEKGDDSHLRWSLRSKDKSGFVFINNYERLQQLSARKNVQFEVCGVKFPQRPMTVPAGAMCIFPVNIDGIRYATAQLIAKWDGKIYLEQIKGIPTEIAVDGKVLKNVKAKGIAKPVYKNIYLVDSKTAEHLFLQKEGISVEQKNGSVKSQTSKSKKMVPMMSLAPSFKKIKEAEGARKITMGVQKVAEEPSDADFKKAAVYQLNLSPEMLQGRKLLQIQYRGDCARLYADGKLVADNFYNGRPFLMGLWRLPADCQKLELRILPLQKDMPVYFPREADVTKEGEELVKLEIINDAL